ncbi:MAG TPA: histidine phosphatase family protein, partial [Gemmatimonadaceae bacterium]
PAADPVLTPAGEARARALAAELGNAGITRILVTPRQRTALTAAPLARARGITPEVIPLGDSTPAHVAAVAAAIRALPPGTKALVVGHSNTVPRIVTALGGPPFRDLCDGEYQTLFIVRLRAGRAATAETRPYGAPNAPGASECRQSPSMMR